VSCDAWEGEGGGGNETELQLGCGGGGEGGRGVYDAVAPRESVTVVACALFSMRSTGSARRPRRRMMAGIAEAGGMN
jgi:hypothetical protein